MDLRESAADTKRSDGHRSGGGPAQPLILSDLRLDGWDEAGYRILDIYARKLPDYVVYRTGQRVAVQFADLRSEAAKQRRMMATLNPLRGEINGLIDGWRQKAEQSGKQHRAKRFDRRVADSLVAALEGDVANAEALLKQIKQDIIDERTAWARFLYLTVAFLAGVVGVLIAFVIIKSGNFPPVSKDLYQAAGAGLIGAFFSIALAIRGRTVLPDLQWIANAMDAALRMVVGLIGAAVLVAMVDAHMVNVTIGLPPSGTSTTSDAPSPAAPREQPNQDAPTVEVDKISGCDLKCMDGAWLNVLIIGFIAGFSERFVPDLLAKAGATAPEPVPKLPPPQALGGSSLVGKKTDEPSGDALSDSKVPTSRIDEQAHDDNCACDAPLEEADATADEHLPAASGGVATANGG